MPVQYINDWLTGPDLQVLNALPANQDGNGNFIDGVPYDLTAVIRRLGHSVRYSTKDVRPCTQPQVNMVRMSVGTSSELTQIKSRRNQSPGQIVHALLATGTHVHLFWQEGHEYFDGYFTVAGLDGGIDGVEEQAAGLSLEPVALSGRAQVNRAFVAFSPIVV